MAKQTNIEETEYTKFPTEQEDFELATLIDTNTSSSLSSLFLDKPVRTIRPDRYPEYANLGTLANKVTWTDTFFDDEVDDDDDDENDIIAVFDFDYKSMEEYYSNLGWVVIGLSAFYPPFLFVTLLGLAPCYLSKNVRWSTKSQHVAITRDGIRFVRDKRKTCWGLSCTDRGKCSKTVPFDKITDCDIEEPAGNTCLCVPNVLTIVNIDTASSGTEGKKELRIAGLKDPHNFKKLVWSMKRAQQLQQSQRNDSDSSSSSTRVNGPLSDEVTSLLREIRDELKVNNELLKNQGTPTDTVETSSPN